MNIVKILAIHTFRAGLGLLFAGLLFLILPLANVFFRTFSDHTTRTVSKPVSLVQIVPEEKKQEQVKEQKLRQLSIPSRQSSIRDMASKFSPDLTIGGAGDGAVIASKQNLENIVYEEGQTDEPPVVLYSIPPKYPSRARDQGIQGIVSVVIVIDQTGHCSKIDFWTLPDEIFRKPVEDAVSKWRFKPAHHKNVPVRVKVRQEFEFGLME